MKCREVQMMLPDYVVNKISNGNLGKIENHIAECAKCKNDAVELHNLMMGLRSYKQEEPPEMYFATIVPRVHDRIEAEKRQFRLPNFFYRFALPVSMVLLIVALSTNLSRFAPTSTITATTTTKVSSLMTVTTFSDSLTSILGQHDYASNDRITETDQEVISQILASVDTPLPLSVDDAKSIASNFDDNDLQNFISLLQQQAAHN